MIKFLGILDILAALFFSIFQIFKSFPGIILIIFGLIILLKGIIFFVSGDEASFLDVLCGIIIISSTLVILPFFINLLVILYLLQKGILSFN